MQKCYENALDVAEHKGYTLYSGFVFDSESGKTFWHCFNVDPQGYVFDSYPYGNDLNKSGVYMGVEYNSYLLTVLLPLTKKTNEFSKEDFDKSLHLCEVYIEDILKDEKRREEVSTILREYNYGDHLDKKDYAEILLGISYAYDIGGLSVTEDEDTRKQEMFSRIGLVLARA